MPRLTPSLFLPGQGRRPQRFPVPFQEVLPLKLKDRVSGKASKETQVACVHEVTELLSCLKNNDFDQARCHAEIQALNKCNEQHRMKKLQKQEQENTGLLSLNNSKTVESRALNRFLKRNKLPKYEK